MSVTQTVVAGNKTVRIHADALVEILIDGELVNEYYFRGDAVSHVNDMLGLVNPDASPVAPVASINGNEQAWIQDSDVIVPFALVTERFSAYPFLTSHIAASESALRANREVVRNDAHTAVLAKNVKKGDYVRFKVGGPVYIREGYDRATATYEFTLCDDMNKQRYVKGSKGCFIGFTY